MFLLTPSPLSVEQTPHPGMPTLIEWCFHSLSAPQILPEPSDLPGLGLLSVGTDTPRNWKNSYKNQKGGRGSQSQQSWHFGLDRSLLWEHPRMCGNIPGLCPWDPGSTDPLSCDNQRCFHIATGPPGGGGNFHPKLETMILKITMDNFGAIFPAWVNDPFLLALSLLPVPCLAAVTWSLWTWYIGHLTQLRPLSFSPLGIWN